MTLTTPQRYEDTGYFNDSAPAYPIQDAPVTDESQVGRIVLYILAAIVAIAAVVAVL